MSDLKNRQDKNNLTKRTKEAPIEKIIKTNFNCIYKNVFCSNARLKLKYRSAHDITTRKKRIKEKSFKIKCHNTCAKVSTLQC